MRFCFFYVSHFSLNPNIESLEEIIYNKLRKNKFGNGSEKSMSNIS
jgi:hypothetical protein